MSQQQRWLASMAGKTIHLVLNDGGEYYAKVIEVGPECLVADLGDGPQNIRYDDIASAGTAA